MSVILSNQGSGGGGGGLPGGGIAGQVLVSTGGSGATWGQEIIAPTANPGTPIPITAGSATGASNAAGGAVTIKSGAGDGSGAGGNINITGGNGGSTGAGGEIIFRAGYQGTNKGSYIFLYGANHLAPYGNGGYVGIFSGDGVSYGANGGAMFIASGVGANTGNGNGGNLTITAEGAAGGNGGILKLFSGGSTSGIPGAIKAYAGTATSSPTAQGGEIFLIAGNGHGGDGGYCTMQGGATTTGANAGGFGLYGGYNHGTGVGGLFRLYGGSSASGAGGPIQIVAGASYGGNNAGGAATIKSGAGHGSGNGGVIGLYLGAGGGTGLQGRLLITGLPTSDPSVSNAIWAERGVIVQSGLSGQIAFLNVADQTVSGGANVTSLSLTTGNITVDCGSRPEQYITNGGAFTITAPSNDGSCIILVTNNASAGTITFSGFSVGSNTGDALNTTNGNKFSIFIWRINGVSGYRVAAMQ